MKHIIAFSFLLISIAGISQTAATSWTIQSSAKVDFSIKNFGATVDGTLSGVSGTIQFDATNLAGSKFDVKVDVSTINTGIDGRDKHLKNEDFFDVDIYPYIYFTSSSIEADGTGYKVNGKLKIKNVEKDVTITFNVTESGTKASFRGEITVNRVDYGVGGTSLTMGDDVTIVISVPAVKS